MEREHLNEAGEWELSQLDVDHTAVLGIHWQRGVIDGTGSFGTVLGTAARRSGAVTRAVALMEGAHQVGVPVVYVNICNPEHVVANNPLFRHAASSGSLRCGTEEVLVSERMPLTPSDILVEHHRASAFVDTDLSSWLLSRRRTSLLVTGVATNVAVEGTLRDAIDRGFEAVLVEDCCAAASAERHAAAVANMTVLATAVTTSEHVLDLWRGSR